VRRRRLGEGKGGEKAGGAGSRVAKEEIKRMINSITKGFEISSEAEINKWRKSVTSAAKPFRS